MEDANFVDFLIQDRSWTFRKNKIHLLLIDIYKPLNHISPYIMQGLFDFKVTPYSLRNNSLLKFSKSNTL